MLLVLFAISVLTFLIFNVIPGGDPAVRLAGKQPQPEQLERIRGAGVQRAGLRPVKWVMGQIFTGDVVSCTTAQCGRRDPPRCPSPSRWRSGGHHLDGLRGRTGSVRR